MVNRRDSVLSAILYALLYILVCLLWSAHYTTLARDQSSAMGGGREGIGIQGEYWGG